jgi:hypothetical protein
VHRLHRVLLRYEARDDVEEWYVARCVLVEVTAASLEACRLDLEDSMRPHGGVVFPPEVLWHSHFRRLKGRVYRPSRLPRRQKDRARLRRELMLRDKQRILDRCFTTEPD